MPLSGVYADIDKSLIFVKVSSSSIFYDQIKVCTSHHAMILKNLEMVQNSIRKSKTKEVATVFDSVVHSLYFCE